MVDDREERETIGEAESVAAGAADDPAPSDQHESGDGRTREDEPSS